MYDLTTKGVWKIFDINHSMGAEGWYEMPDYIPAETHILIEDEYWDDEYFRLPEMHQCCGFVEIFQIVEIFPPSEQLSEYSYFEFGRVMMVVDFDTISNAVLYRLSID